MISIKKLQHKSVSAFTLIEMVIVLVIIGILLMSTLYFTGEQIQKVRDKTVKESILAEWQSRFSRNLWSSSYGWKMYDHLDISLTSGDNKITFKYIPKNSEDTGVNNEFTDRFVISNIIIDPNNYDSTENITFRYRPYQISCEWWNKKDDGDDIGIWIMNNSLLFIARVNDSRDYCFEIQKKNCRLMEVSAERCNMVEHLSSNQQE